MEKLDSQDYHKSTSTNQEPQKIRDVDSDWMKTTQSNLPDISDGQSFDTSILK